MSGAGSSLHLDFCGDPANRERTTCRAGVRFTSVTKSARTTTSQRVVSLSTKPGLSKALMQVLHQDQNENHDHNNHQYLIQH